MKSINELPAEVIIELEKNPESAWRWFSERYYAQQAEQAGHELLVQVRQRFNLEKLIASCQGYRHYAGKRGQEATHEIAILCWAVLLKYLLCRSYRKTCQEIRNNTQARCFVGYRLDQATLSYVTLQRFEVWVMESQPRTLFTEILRQIDEDCPEAARQAQIGDTFALLANVAAQSRTEMLRDGCRRLLHYFKQINHLAYANILGSLKCEELFGAEGELPEYCLDKAQRDALELRTALAADACLRLLWQPVAGLPRSRKIEFLALQRWLAILDKMLRDEFVFERGAEADSLSARLCTDKERGSFVIGSTLDPEATFRKHGEKNQLGYNVQVAATEHFIREIFANTGATNDGSGVAPLVANQLEHLGTVPPKLIYDRAAGSPKIFHDVAKASNGKTQLVARLIDHAKNSTRFAPLDFTLNEDGSLTCPNGKSTHTFYRSHSAEGWNYRFSAEQCKDCPLWTRCRGEIEPLSPTPTPAIDAQSEPSAPATATPDTPKANKRKSPKATAYRQACTERSRSVFISKHRDFQRKAILYTKTAQFKLDMKFRSTIERIIAALVRYNEARVAHSKGVAKADFQARMAATAFNLKKWHKLRRQRENATHYKAPDSS